MQTETEPANPKSSVGKYAIVTGLVALVFLVSFLARRQNDTSYETHNRLGLALMQREQWSDAIREFRAAIAVLPAGARDVQLHVQLGGALLGNGQAADAILEFHQASSLAPDDAEIHDYLGTALLANGRTNDAMIEFQKALALKPGFEPAQRNLARAMGMQNK